ncbi:MAG: PAS domain S-box protein [Candidatus Scalinduaceae bacterium]
MKFTKFGTKLFCFFLLVSLLPLGIAGAIIYKYVYDRTKGEVLGQLQTTAHNLKERLHLLLRERRSRITYFSSDGFIRDCVEQMLLKTPEYSQISKKLYNHLIINKKSLDPDILEIEILNYEGKVIASTSQEQIGKDKSHENYFRVPFLSQEQKGPYFADAIERTKKSDKLQFVFSGILTDKILHEPLGVIVTKVNGRIIQDILDISKYQCEEENSINDYGEIYIVNKEKLMIANSSGSGSFRQIVETKAVQEVLVSRGKLSGIYENYKGIIVLSTVLFVPETNWVILAEKNIKEAFLPLTRIKYIFAISGGGAIFLVFLFAFVISGNINAIIKKLIEGTRRVADGDLEHPIIIGKRKDEIRELGKSFNLMMNKLRESLEKVRKSEEKYRELFETVKDGIVFTDLEGNVLDCNKEYLDMLGYSMKEVRRKKYQEITPPKWDDIEQDLFRAQIVERGYSDLYEKEYIKKDGTVFPISIRIWLIKDERGIAKGMWGIARDITEQKKAERQLIEKAKELEAVNIELEDFVYIVSHDLKEPLFAIEGYTSRLPKIYKDILDDKGKHYIDRIRVNVKNMSQKIYEIMEVVKVGRVIYNFKNNDIEVIIKDVVNSLEGRVKKNKINVLIEDNLPTVFCDRERLKDVFSNLVTNAIKFMGKDKSPLNPPNSPPTSCFHKKAVGGINKGGIKGGFRKIRIGCDKDGDCYRFFVEDTGIGIPAKYQERIFKIFRRLNDIETEGTGVGLAIVKKIVELHDGKIWVESPVNEGKGSRFCFTMPIMKEISGHQN